VAQLESKANPKAMSTVHKIAFFISRLLSQIASWMKLTGPIQTGNPLLFLHRLLCRFFITRLRGEIELDEARSEAGAKARKTAQQPATCRSSASWSEAAGIPFVLLRVSRPPRG
jgi:hypothetical protein